VYLKQLDILGFKSFANKTTITFSSGITSIVGPNGCGKTNILDSLRWVLGEQKISLLRGSKMEEVIFNGTRDAKPLGMAEVTLTLVNDRGVLPTEYNEIQITRRLFRSGESEYLLNKVPCRRKDITELFFGTGVGPHSYSVIQPDMIDAVISDKAEERRFLFEEAAGITKYKQRKKAALRKLEATENDLLRLRDIYAEVKTQVNSLKRQYKKAERYQDVRDDIKAWDLYLGSKHIKTADQNKRELKAQIDTLASRLINREAQIDGVSAQLETDRKEQLDLEQTLSEISSEIYDISERAHAIENQISVLREKKANAHTLIERDSDDIKALEARAQILSEQTNQERENLSRHRQELEQIRIQLEETETAQAEADRNLLGARALKDQENGKLLELEGKLSSGKTEDVSLKQQQEELNELLTDRTRQLDENRELQTRLLSELQQHQQQRDELAGRKTEFEASQKRLSNELESLVEKNEEYTTELSGVSASIEACQARKNLLEDMMLHYEGYQSGVVAAMEVQDRWPGIAGTVADKFVPVEGMEIALEGALGEISGFLICHDRTTAENIVAYLKAEKKGRIGILVEDTGTLNPVVKRPEIDRPEFVGWLDSFITTEEKHRPLMHAVLARVAVFKADTSPQEILRHLPYGFSAVSTDGMVYGQHIITGGSDDGFPLFRRKEKVAEQNALLEELNRKLENLQQEKNQVTIRIAEVRAESGELASKLESLAEDLVAAQKIVDERTYNLRSSESDTQRLQREYQADKEKLERIRNRQYSLELDYNQLAHQKATLVENISSAGKELGDFELAATHGAERVSSLQVKMVEARSKVEQTESRIAHQNELQTDISHTITSKSSEIEGAHTEIDGSSSRVTELEGELKNVFDLRTEATSKHRGLKEKQAHIFELLSGKEEALKSLRRERDEATRQQHELDIKLTTMESEINSITERIHEEYQVDPATVEVTCPNEEIADEQAREHLHEQKEKLKTFGAVNLVALEEYKTTSEREKFLREHLDDLTTAKTDLQTTIGKINQTARQMFQETFAQVKINFRNLFIELFTGGEADLRLEDPTNPLESNIEIIARPRGKKLLSITMMSGGERALTAISLLFSLYLVKPSPYCILDEIDAPLDDANCKRFLKMLDSFSAHTQFIAITHNKITMEAAKNLYGVTMVQPGISQLVGVRFSDITQDEKSGEVLIDIQAAQTEPPPEVEEEPVDLPPAIAERVTGQVNTEDLDSNA
jgi:chromosome segregation protein